MEYSVQGGVSSRHPEMLNLKLICGRSNLIKLQNENSASCQSYRSETSRRAADPELEPKAAGEEADCVSPPASCRHQEQVVPGRASRSKPLGRAAYPRFLGRPLVPEPSERDSGNRSRTCWPEK